MDFFCKLQVGLVLKGTVVDSTLAGGPAYTSSLLARGDVLLEVDGRTATEENVSFLLVGCDQPGSRVVLTVAKGGKEVHKQLNCFSRLVWIK
jgi:S1-C subfamily serine protease